jgi:hypothetical protein
MDRLDFSEDNAMAGVIRVMKMERIQSGQMELTFDVRTSVGNFPFDLKIPDQGSMAKNEEQALQELEKVFREALETVQHQLA